MDISLTLSWIALFLLGAFHGINPAMGWLFAVALGLQEKRRAAVWRSLLPLALGHALAVGVAILLAGLIGLVIPLTYLKWGVAGVLLGFGLFHLARHWHPRFGGMQIGLRDLTVWSFLMATAHGAGLMVLPFIFGAAMTAPPTQHAGPVTASGAHHSHTAVPMHGHDEMIGMEAASDSVHADHVAALLADLPSEPLIGLLATLVHTIGYLVVLGLVAVIVYEKVGLRWLRSAWVNLDVIWAGALVITALLTVIL